MSAVLTFDYAQFIEYFPQFNTYSEPELQLKWDTAIFYVSDIAHCGSVQGQKRQYAIYLMMAHLLYISELVISGNTSGVMESASIDKVSVSLQPPPGKTEFNWWLNSSPYGQQLAALLLANSVGGYSAGGSPVLGSFRWGNYGRGGRC